MWAEQAEGLKTRFRLVMPDAFGFGETSPPDAPWDMAALAGGCLEAADQLDLESFAVVGLSMGGYAAFEMLRQAPGRISRLVLANTRARGDTPEEQKARTELAGVVEESGTGILIERMMGRLLGKNPSSGTVERVESMIRQARPKAIVHGLAALAGRTDATALLAGIPCPTLVIAGAEDSITPSAESRAMAGAIPGCRFIEIPAAGHLSNLENAGAFSDELERFLLAG
jgi:pimeloyl-ACP methyl ester carboxylesterase